VVSLDSPVFSVALAIICISESIQAFNFSVEGTPSCLLAHSLNFSWDPLGKDSISLFNMSSLFGSDCLALFFAANSFAFFNLVIYSWTADASSARPYDYNTTILTW